MKYFYQTLFSVSVISLAMALPAQAELIEIPLTKPNEPVEIEIDVLHGSIEVIGEARDDVAIEVTGSNTKGRRIVTPSGTKMIPLSNYAVEAEERNNRVSISSDWKSQGMTIVARVPARADLDLSAVHGGRIEVNSVEGRLELSNVHGGIVARNVSGTAIAETVHGSVEVELNRVTSDKPMAFTTVHGDIDLYLPDDFGANVTIDSRQNEIYSDFEVDIMPSSPNIKRNSHRRGTKFELEQVLKLSVNGGGTPIRIETLHGDVSLRKSR